MELKIDKSKNTQTIKRKDVKDTPFTIITLENKSFATLGKFQITEKYDTVAEAEKEVRKLTWNRITQVISLIIELTNQQNNKT